MGMEWKTRIVIHGEIGVLGCRYSLWYLEIKHNAEISDSLSCLGGDQKTGQFESFMSLPKGLASSKALICNGTLSSASCQGFLPC